MIKEMHFQNFKALRDTTLELGQFTLLIGANGSGKTTAMQALRLVPDMRGHYQEYMTWARRPGLISAESPPPVSTAVTRVSITVQATNGQDKEFVVDISHVDNGLVTMHSPPGDSAFADEDFKRLETFRMFQFEPHLIAESADLVPTPELDESGANLVVVLDALRDREPERFELLNQELGRWLPEYDRILFETPQPGKRAFLLRTRVGQHHIRVQQLSQGALLALAFLTVAYLPQPPAIVCFEEPEHGIHPRLLRNVQEAMYRLAYPESFGESRAPVQVIATTHSPYLLDLFRDHPEEVVIAERTAEGSTFRRLTDMPEAGEIFKGQALGDLWFSGIFGGVPEQV